MSFYLADYKENTEGYKIAITDNGDSYFLNKGNDYEQKYKVNYDDYKKIISKLFSGREKQQICGKVEKILNDKNDDYNKYGKSIMDFCDIVKEREDKRKCIYVDDGVLYPVLKKDSFNCVYITGGSGSGKSYMTNEIMLEYHKNNKKNNIYLISRLDDKNDVLQKNKFIQKIDCSTFVKEPINYEEFGTDAMIIFDDFESYENTNKPIYKAIIGLLNELMTLGRHLRFSIIICSHLTSNYKATRLVMVEATHFIMYPKTSSDHALKHVLQTYGGLNKDTIEDISNCNSRYVCLYRHYPKILLFEHKIEFVK
jgi:hypothetical protein